MLLAACSAEAFAECPGDLDGNGVVNGSDLGVMLISWGGADAVADLDGDGVVGGSDIGLLLIGWGPCPCEAPPAFEPLHSASTPLEPEVRFERADALVTRLADRARDRHAREDIVNGVVFRKYDHYLPFYWEQRVAELEIVDRVAMGGEGVTFNFTTLAQLDPAEFRTFYADTDSLALYLHNLSDIPGQGVTLESVTPSTRYPGETEYAYSATITHRQPGGAALEIGDSFEVELSQFLLAPRNGRENYYGTAFLYEVGRGVVPWYARDKEEATTPAEREAASFLSHPLPEHAWLGGETTLPYQYSNEPRHRFKQTAGNISSESGHRFMQGRRLHHTDFRDGSHSEPENPIFDEQVGKAGPLLVAASCVACHRDNGRALPVAVGEPLRGAVVHVAADETGTPHPIWGESLQHDASAVPPIAFTIEAEAFTAMSGVATEPCSDAGGGLDVASIDANDWMAYGNHPLAIPESGTYLVDLRVASAIGGGMIRIEEAGGSVLHALAEVPATGGGQTWTTITVEATLEAGTHVFGLNAAVGGWKLNWFRVRSLPGGNASEPRAILAGWEETAGSYGDGTPYSLRKPIYAFEMPPGVDPPQHFAVRLAPPLVGLGLLEAIDESTILAREDACDLDGDGISGRVHAVTSPLESTANRLGRFGTKASQAAVRHQIAYALNRDMGIATAAFPVLDGDTSASAVELDAAELDDLTRYVSLLGVSARRSLTDETALHGEQRFAAAGCSACHVAELATGPHHPFAELRNQTIRPFTDLLLHDLGPGLADSIESDGVDGSEWRTPPLWSIGLTAGVAGGEAYLHDGRARTLEEAILWHGGEAEASKEYFRTMSSEDRAAVIAFLRSL